MKQKKTFLLLLFFISGITSLIYEIIWAKTLSNLFGKTTIAITLVISSYMAGLGTGGLLAGNFIDKKKSPIKTYSSVQFYIAFFSLLSYFIILNAKPIIDIFLNLEKISNKDWTIITFIFSFITLLIPSSFMGATFPIMNKIVVKNKDSMGTSIGLIYSINTLGAIIGAGVSGYFLIGAIGQFATYIFAISLNFIIGIFSFILSHKKSDKPILSTEKDEKNIQRYQLKNENKFFPFFLLFVSLITGLTSLAFEVLTERVLSILLLNSTYSFTSILVVYLTGITIGSFLYSKFISKTDKELLVLTTILTITGFYILIISSSINDIPLLLTPFYNNILKIALFSIILPGLTLSSVMLLLPAIFMGITFPMICRLYSNNIENIGNNIAKIYFLNTIGCIIGPILATFIMIPKLGVVKSFISIAFIYILISLLTITYIINKKEKLLLAVYISIIIVISLFFIKKGLTDYKIVPPSFSASRDQKDSIIYYKETASGTVVAVKDKNNTKGLFVNNNAACGVTYDAIKVVKMLGHLPFLYNNNIKKALIIGFGIGVTTSEVARHPVENIDCVEIVPGVKDAAYIFREYNKDVINNPRLNFISGDGRTYIQLTNKKYDLISCDPIHPTLNSSSLYTKEYFELCKARLTENGVISQYLPLHKLSVDQYKSIVKTFSTVFPYVHLWLGYSHSILIGSLKDVELDFNRILTFANNNSDIYLNDPYQIASSLLLDHASVISFSKEANIHTDDRPFLEFFSPSDIKEENWHLNLQAIRKHRSDIYATIKNVNKTTMNRYLEAQKIFLDGMELKNMGYKTLDEMEEVIKLFKKAYITNPENREIKAVLSNDIDLYNQIKNSLKIF